MVTATILVCSGYINKTFVEATKSFSPFSDDFQLQVRESQAACQQTIKHTAPKLT